MRILPDNKNLKQKGQAIFELLIFLPLMLIFLALLVKLTGALNGAINQQKVTRGYFFFSVKNNSMIPRKEVVVDLAANGVSRIGTYMVGWRKEFDSNVPVAACYKMPVMSDVTEETDCGHVSVPGQTTYVRVYTAYGVCSNIYISQGQGTKVIHGYYDGGGDISGSCMLR